MFDLVVFTEDVDPRAVYILTYEVLYNTSQTSHVTSTCGEHYAHSFLKNFVSAEQKLNESCEYLRINVTVDVRARVRIYGNKVRFHDSRNVCRDEKLILMVSKQGVMRLFDISVKVSR